MWTHTDNHLWLIVRLLLHEYTMCVTQTGVGEVSLLRVCSPLRNVFTVTHWAADSGGNGWVTILTSHQVAVCLHPAKMNEPSGGWIYVSQSTGRQTTRITTRPPLPWWSCNTTHEEVAAANTKRGVHSYEYSEYFYQCKWLEIFTFKLAVNGTFIFS